jgi:CheY-like chemotaxis protein
MLIQRILNALLGSSGTKIGGPPSPRLEPCLDAPVNHFDRLQSEYWFNNVQHPGNDHKPKAKNIDINDISILLVEDDIVNQRITKHLLSKMGLEVDIASNGMSCIKQLKKKRYDLILMDIHMPVMDGVEATRIIRSEPGFDDKIKIVGLTASNIQADLDGFASAGMDDVLIKPLKLESLKSKISLWFV